MEKIQKMKNFSVEVPEELQRQILSWMPPKFLLKFMCVSKNWASIIRDKHFEDLYLAHSKTRPRVLFAFCRKLFDPTKDLLFHSVYQEEKLLLSDQQHMRISNHILHEISTPVRGLICLQSGSKIVICNPGTRKFRTLPEIPDAILIYGSFLGYDEVTKVFKVLCTTFTSFTTYEVRHQALTLGSGEESWRTIMCEHHHTPATSGLWKGEVLYYGARSKTSDKSLVVSFNVRSEEFTVIDLPQGLRIGPVAKLVNVNGDVVLVNDSVYDKGVIPTLVFNEIDRVWWKGLVVIPGWRETVGDMRFCFEGIIGTNDLVFGLKGLLNDGSHLVVYYNTFTQKFEMSKTEGRAGGSYHFARIFLDHVDSLSLP